VLVRKFYDAPRRPVRTGNKGLAVPRKSDVTSHLPAGRRAAGRFPSSAEITCADDDIMIASAAAARNLFLAETVAAIPSRYG